MTRKAVVSAQELFLSIAAPARAGLLPRLGAGGVCLAAILLALQFAGFEARAQTLAPALDKDPRFFVGNELNPDVAIDPTNASLMFLVANTNVNAGLYGLFSTSSGSSWSFNPLTNLPAGFNGSVAWDGYGNLFLAYDNGVFNSGTFSGVEIAYSTNKGTNFTILTNLAAGDTVLQQPRLAVGQGSALGSLWVAYKDYNALNASIVAQGLSVTGLGTFGTFTAQEVVSGATPFCGFPSVSVGPAGQVLVAYQTNFASPGTSAIYVNANPAGLNSNAFGTPVLAATKTIGGDTRILPMPNHGINSAPTLVYNCSTNSFYTGQVYLGYVGQGAANANDTDIFVTTSTNDGANWGRPVKVNDDHGTNYQFMPRAAVDPGDGILALSWYDCRNDNGYSFSTNTQIVTNYSYATGTGAINTDGSTNVNTNVVTNIVVTTNMSGTTDSVKDDDAMVYASISINGGASFLANSNLTSPSFTTNGYNSGAAGTIYGFGDYTGLAFESNNFYAVWADNSGSAGANTQSAPISVTIFTTNESVGPAMGASNLDQITITTNVSSNTMTGWTETHFDLSVDEVTVGGLSDISVTSTLNTSNMLVAGSTPNYSIIVKNLGPNTANNVVVNTQFLPPTVTVLTTVGGLGSNSFNTNTIVWNVGSMGPGAQSILTAIIVVPQTLAITNTNSATSPNYDVNLTNNGEELISPVAISADLAVSLSGEVTTITNGGSFTYDISVTNAGPLPATNAMVTNTFPTNFTLTGLALPPGVMCLTNQNMLIFELGTMTNGQSDSMAITLQATGPGSGTDLVEGEATTLDFDPANNSAFFGITVPQPPPAIANVSVSVVSASAAIITWTTPTPATGQVLYGLTTNYGSSTWKNPALSTTHSVLLSGLQPNTAYSFEILSVHASTLAFSTGSFATVGPIIMVTEQAGYTGSWTTGGQVTAYQGEYRYTSGVSTSPTATATFTPVIPVAGDYDVFAWYPTNNAFSTNTPIVLTGGTNAMQGSLDESTNGGQWVQVASSFFFSAGTSGSLEIRNDSGTTNAVVANAVQWIYSLNQDAASNGIVPSWWANYYFGVNSVSGSADLDGDGYSNYAEYILGTDPTSAASQLQMTVTQTSPTNTEVLFGPFQGARTYTLQAATNLLNPTWIALTNTPSQDTNGAGVFTISNAGPGSTYYRLAVTAQP